METTFESLVGKTLVKIDVSIDEIEMLDSDGYRYRMYHSQDCCESVTIEDICGDINLLLNSPITIAEEIDSQGVSAKEGTPSDYSYTWTFYKLGTVKETVTIRWYGESNGFYSESVEFIKL